MDEQGFRALAKEEGYADPVLVEWDAGHVNDAHSHEFDAHIFVLEGDITVSCGDISVNLAPGSGGRLKAGLEHTEQIGPNGVKFLAARR